MLDVPGRRIDVRADLDAREPAPAMLAALARPTRGWEGLYTRTVLGADTGADLDFLVGKSGSAVARESH